MTAHVKVGGVWRTLNPKIKVGGAWKGLNGGFVKVGGAWRRFYPAPGVLDVQHMTTGTQGVSPNDSYGFYAPNGMGALADGNSNIYGQPIVGIYWSLGPQQLTFAVGGVWTNTGFTNMNINGVNYSRASALFLTSGGNTFWSWNGIAANPVANNPTVTFT
jgi:hypothetical protein